MAYKFPMRVFQGINGQAGQPSVLAEALREQGVEAHCHCSLVNKFAYESDIKLDIGRLSEVDYFREYFLSLALNYDIFHFHSTPIFSCRTLHYPFLEDLKLLKALGKKIVFHFRGSEARLRSKAIEKNPYHFFDLKEEKIELLKFVWSENKQKEYVRHICELVDRVYVNDEEIQTYVPIGKIIPRAFRARDFKPSLESQRRVRVLHAPNKRGIKGSEFVFAAVENLRKQNIDFEFVLVENMTHEQSLKAYEQADIVIDQLRIGWYGVLTVEAMSMGKPVLCYIREDLAHHLGQDPPLMITNPERLAHDLKKIIEDESLRVAIGQRAKSYFDRIHSHQVVAQLLVTEYKALLQDYHCIEQELAQKIIEPYAQAYAQYCAREKLPLRKLKSDVCTGLRLFQSLSFPVFLQVAYNQLLSRLRVG